MDGDGAYLCRTWVDIVQVLTQYTYEKKWSNTTESEALKLIETEMPQTDVQSTWAYIVSEIKKGKTVTLGDCRFKLESQAK